MEVRATAEGYYDLKTKKEGDTFTIKSEKDFSSIWMERVDGKEAPVKAAKTKPPKPSPKDVHDEALEKTIDEKAEAGADDDVI